MTPCTRRQLLAGVAATAARAIIAPAQPARDIRIACELPQRLGDYGLGVRLGATEAERAAMLLGHRFTLVHDEAGNAAVARGAPASSAVPVVAMSGESDDRCLFITASPHRPASEADHMEIVDWHPAFRRYGAGELNERFEKAFARPMTSDAWHGWVAVKAIVEASIRGEDLCAELARLRFDGHKGRALAFDPATRRLRHPALMVRTEGGRPIVEVVP